MRMTQELYVPEEEALRTESLDWGINRRNFIQFLGAGLVISVTLPALAQRRGGGESARPVAARIHIGRDGKITLLAGKVEMGQGARAELTQAAAEELRVPARQVNTVLADTDLVPDDGLSAGSRTTPATVPSVRKGAAAARQLLLQLAAQELGVDVATLEMRDGIIRDPVSGRTIGFGKLTESEAFSKSFAEAVPEGVTITPVQDWKCIGTSVPRPNARDLVTGAHKYPSDVIRPGMLYGKVLRPPSYGAKLEDINVDSAKEIEGVKVVRDGNFIGVAAPSTHKARQASEALAKSARWQTPAHVSSQELYDHLRSNARGGIPKNPFEIPQGQKSVRAVYNVAYVQHAPLETRTALAEWADDKLTVWAGTQNPFGYKNELANAFSLSHDKVRVVVPDFGSGFGGKHTAEAAIEAARIARGAGKPVLLHWTREEEFTWAYFRPAGVIEIESALNDKDKIASWHFVNINSGGSAIETPYRIPNARSRFVESDAPLRQGSYRGLAATANTFARECFMDELAVAAGEDPLQFRLKHLENPRLRAVLEEAAKRFEWDKCVHNKQANVGVGLACGTEKGSYVATCAQVAIDNEKKISIKKVTEVFECGAVINPANLLSQIQGAIIMGIGPALREEMRFSDGKMRNAHFEKYMPPRFSDVPELDIHVLNRTDLPSVGAGETPLIAIAPAVGNAVFHATGVRLRAMPMRLDTSREA